MPSLDVRLIRQVEDHFCGPAVAAMLLDFRQLKPTGVSDETWQHQIWDDVVSGTTGPSRPPAATGAPGYIEEFHRQQCVLCAGQWSCWATTPQALVAVLNGGFSAEHHVSAVRSSILPDAAVDAVLNSIDGGAPAAVMVDDGDHWVVVRGYKAGKSTPTPVPIGERNLNGVWIRDPFPDAQTRRLVAAEEFIDERFFPVDCGVTADDDRYVAIVDSRAIRREARMVRRPPTEAKRLEPFLTPEAARKAAADYAKALLAEDDEPAQDPLVNATPGAPVLVQRLDREDEYFYIVPFENSGKITSRMAIDAKTGRLKEVQWIEDTSSTLPPWRSPDEFLKRYVGDPYPPRAADQEPSRRRSPVVRRETLGVHPVLVWRPCPESRSLFAPFQLLINGDQLVYVKVDDGQVFLRLTSSGKGR